jgi:hypothetical protein
MGDAVAFRYNLQYRRLFFFIAEMWRYFSSANHPSTPSIAAGHSTADFLQRQVLIGNAPVMLLNILSYRYCVPAQQKLNGELFT